LNLEHLNFEKNLREDLGNDPMMLYGTFTVFVISGMVIDSLYVVKVKVKAVKDHRYENEQDECKDL